MTEQSRGAPHAKLVIRVLESRSEFVHRPQDRMRVGSAGQRICLVCEGASVVGPILGDRNVGEADKVGGNAGPEVQVPAHLG